MIAAKYIIVGNVFKAAERIRIDARVIEVETGTIKFAERVSGNAYNLSMLAEKLGHLLLMRIANPPELRNLPQEEVIIKTNNVVYSEVLDLIGNSQIEVKYNEPFRTKDGEFGWILLLHLLLTDSQIILIALLRQSFTSFSEMHLYRLIFAI